MGTTWSDGNWGRQRRAGVTGTARRNTAQAITTPLSQRMAEARDQNGQRTQEREAVREKAKESSVGGGQPTDVKFSAGGDYHSS